MDSYDILVIILSIMLALFLVLACAATILFIQLLKKLHKASDSAKVALNNVESITGSMKSAAKSSLLAGIAASFLKKYTSKK